MDTLKGVNLYTVRLSYRCRKLRAYGTKLEEPVLWRRNRDMAITVRADVRTASRACRRRGRSVRC